MSSCFRLCRAFIFRTSSAEMLARMRACSTPSLVTSLAGQQVLRADVFEDAQQQLQLVRLAHEPVLAMHAWVRQHTGAERPPPEWRARGW